MPSLKAGSIVKVDRFEVAKCSSMYKIIDHPFLIRFISPTIIDEHHMFSRDQSPIITRLFDNFQVIANTNLELPGILSYCIWVYNMFRYHNWYLNSHIWLGKYVLSRALTSPKKQLKSLSISTLIRKKQSTHKSIYITVYIVLTSIIKKFSTQDLWSSIYLPYLSI